MNYVITKKILRLIDIIIFDDNGYSSTDRLSALQANRKSLKLYYLSYFIINFKIRNTE